MKKLSPDFGQLGPNVFRNAVEPLFRSAILGGMGQDFWRLCVSFHHGGKLQFAAALDQSPNASFVALIRGFVENSPGESGRQILLCYPVVLIGVGIQVVCPVTKAFGIAVGILKMVGDRRLALCFDAC